MLAARVRYERFGVFGNLVYGKIGDDSTKNLSSTTAQLSVSSKMTFFDFGLTYRFDPMPIGSAGSDGTQSSVVLEPYVGGRYTNVQLDADFGIGGFNRSFSNTISFVDPIVGLRTEWELSDRWAAVVSADIGGFGVGSDFSWNAIGLVGYRFGMFRERDAAVFLGYRGLGQNYSDGSGASRQEWDVITHGPIIGLNVRF